MAILYRPEALTVTRFRETAPWGINPSFPGLFPCKGQVPYALRTRAPVAGKRASPFPLPLDLHVLGLPLAFILSQDQTLHRCPVYKFTGRRRRSSRPFPFRFLNLFCPYNMSMNFTPCTTKRVQIYNRFLKKQGLLQRFMATLLQTFLTP